MVPRFKPFLGSEEIRAALGGMEDAVRRFEEAFARAFEARYALAFSYGRSAIWCFLKALGIEGEEVIIPAYTCSVVAHAVVLSGNTPRFVDASLHDYNMDLSQLEGAISRRTRVIIATHLFGHPMDIDRLKEVVERSQRRLGHKIWILQDCAHCFGARWKGRLVCNEADAAIFGLNASKMITSIFGGIATTGDRSIYERMEGFRKRNFRKPSAGKMLRRLFYLLALYPAFNSRLYGLVERVQRQTSWLDSLTKAYHMEEKIRFPPDYRDFMLALEAKVGLTQLAKYQKIERRRVEIARYYHETLSGLEGILLPPHVEGATYSHFVALVEEPRSWAASLRKEGIELGQVIEYVIPEMEPYRRYASGTYPNAKLLGRKRINLPIHPSLTEGDLELISSAIVRTAHRISPKVQREPPGDYRVSGTV